MRREPLKLNNSLFIAAKELNALWTQNNLPRDKSFLNKNTQILNRFKIWNQNCSLTVTINPLRYFISSTKLLYSRLSLSRSSRDSEILRDIHTSTYQNCIIEEKINRTTTFNKCICDWTLEIRDILKILWERGEIAPVEQFLFFSTVFYYLLLDFHV